MHQNNNRRYRERGITAFATPRIDAPEDMAEEWRNGNITAMKRHFIDTVTKPRGWRTESHVAGYGNIDNNAEEYFELWARISNKHMNEDGFLVSGKLHVSNDRLSLMLDRNMKGDIVHSIKTPSLKHNIEKAVEILKDSDTFYEYFAPLFFGCEVNKKYQLWCRDHCLEGLEGRHMCCIFDNDYTGNPLCLFVRRDVLRKYIPESTLSFIEECWHKYSFTL